MIFMKIKFIIYAIGYWNRPILPIKNIFKYLKELFEKNI